MLNHKEVLMYVLKKSLLGKKGGFKMKNLHIYRNAYSLT